MRSKPEWLVSAAIASISKAEDRMELHLAELLMLSEEHGGVTARLWRERIRAGATYHAAARQYDRLLRLLREHRALVPFREERRLNARGGRVDVIVPGWTIGDVRRIAIRIRLINAGARQYAGLEREARRVGGAA